MMKAAVDVVAPVIPLDSGDLYEKERTKGESIVLELKTNPSAKDSTTYKFNAFILRDHMGIEEFIVWQLQLQKIIEKQPIKAASDKIAMAQQLIQGDRLVAFESALAAVRVLREEEATEKADKPDKKGKSDKKSESAKKKPASKSTGTEETPGEVEIIAPVEVGTKRAIRADPTWTNTDFVNLIHTLSNHIFPLRALRYQRRYMRQKVRKPKEMTARSFVARVTQMNGYLKFFPPFKVGQVMTNDELLELLDSAVPNAWKKEFLRTGYDPVDHDLATFIERCERIEYHEDISDTKSNKQNKPNGPSANTEQKAGAKSGAKSHAKSSGEAKSNKKKGPTKNSDKYCTLHECHGHSTDECKVVQAQITKMREAWKNTSSEAKFQKKNDNKKRTNDLHSLVQEAVASALKKSAKRHNGARGETNVMDEVEVPQYYSESDDSSNN